MKRTAEDWESGGEIGDGRSGFLRMGAKAKGFYSVVWRDSGEKLGD